MLKRDILTILLQTLTVASSITSLTLLIVTLAENRNNCGSDSVCIVRLAVQLAALTLLLLAISLILLSVYGHKGMGSGSGSGGKSLFAYFTLFLLILDSSFLISSRWWWWWQFNWKMGVYEASQFVVTATVLLGLATLVVTFIVGVPVDLEAREREIGEQQKAMGRVLAGGYGARKFRQYEQLQEQRHRFD